MDGYIKIAFFVLLQIVAVGSAGFFWYQVYPKKEESVDLWTGIVLYLICPYRLLYGVMTGNMYNAIGFSILPMILLALQDFEKKKKQLVIAFGALVCLVITGYTDFRLFLVFEFMLLILTVLKKKFLMTLLWALGFIAVLPGNLSVVKYVLLGQPVIEVQLGSIMSEGYEISNLFRAFVLKENKPGMGVGLLICCACIFWNILMRRKENMTREMAIYMVISAILTLFSLKYFPWDYAQRVAGFTLRGVSYFANPAIFFGVAQICISVCGTRAVSVFRKEEEKNVGNGLLFMLLITGIGESIILLKNI